MQKLLLRNTINVSTLNNRTTYFIAILLSIFFLSACTSHQIYRTDTSVCISSIPEQECQQHTLQQYQDPQNDRNTYLISFIEFDDQGQLWNREQIDSVFTRINEEAGQADVLMVTFVHGWKHSAAPGDDNIKMFRRTLHRLMELENRISDANSQQKPRKVIGIYLGWRGGSVSLPVAKELTFWDRKNTAHKVGHGGVTEVLTRLELVKKAKDTILKTEAIEAIKKKDKRSKLDLHQVAQTESKTRLIIVGHSLGGAVVFSALSQIIEGRFIDTHGPLGQITNARSFGDLVVLINPAFEATRFSALSDMATERGSYFASQLPVLVVLTSETDNATKIAFPIGRWFSTLFEKEHDVRRKNAVTKKQETIDQGKANIYAIGHFEPYRTHYLRANKVVNNDALVTPTVEEDIRSLFAISDRWENDTPGSSIAFYGSTLERSSSSAGRNPYLVVQVDENLIPNHNDIDDPRVISFLRQIILLASHRDNTKG